MIQSPLCKILLLLYHYITATALLTNKRMAYCASLNIAWLEVRDLVVSTAVTEACVRSYEVLRCLSDFDGEMNLFGKYKI